MQGITITVIIPILLVLALSSCGYSGYDSLSEAEKQVVDLAYANIDKWETTTLEYANFRVRGEYVMRGASFVQYNDELSLRVTLSLDRNGMEIVQKYYTCNSTMTLADSKYSRMAYSSGWDKTYKTTWSQQEKLDYLSQRIYDYGHK